MKVYQVNYDLRKQRNYEPLYERLKSYGTYSHSLDSTWIIVTDQTARQIRDYLYAVMDGDDGLLVTRLQGEWASVGLRESTDQWLEKRLAA